jgi:hypothetical protein
VTGWESRIFDARDRVGEIVAEGLGCMETKLKLLSLSLLLFSHARVLLSRRVLYD